MNVDVRYKNCTTYTLAKIQIFKINSHTCFYKQSKYYSYALKDQGCDNFYTEQTGTTN
jgi:hypothetical protein